MLRKRVVVLVAAAVMLLSMLVAAAPAFAQGEGFDQGVGGSDPQPGQTEKAQSPQIDPPQGKPGVSRRDSSAAEHDQSDSRSSFGKRVDAQQG